jgi:glycosyltransferase involved in cell wall biosynthesis
MRVVYLNPCGQMGGAETSLRELLASVREAEPGWELYLVLGEDGPLIQIAQALGVQVVVLPFPKTLSRIGDAGRGRFKAMWSLVRAAFGTTAYAQRLARSLRELSPDIIHTNGFKMHLLGTWKRPSQASLVWHIHDYVSTRPVMSRLVRRCARRADAVIVNSRSVGADLSVLCPDLKVVPIYNAINLDRFAPQGEVLDLDSLAGLPAAPSGTIRVGLVGTFARWKGHHIFLRALSRLPATTAVRGYVIGGPIYQTDGSQWSIEELKEEAKRLGLTDKVGFTGFIADAPAAMRFLDVIVHASTQPEPFGMVIIEGMACGKAVIASQAGGASELFRDGENALGHAPGCVDGLAAQIQRLADDRQLRSRLGAAGRAAAERLYDRRRLAEELLKLYRQVTGGSSTLLPNSGPTDAKVVAETSTPYSA